MIWWALAILTVAALIAAPFLAEALRPAMRGAARACAPGQFADLPGGQTHYQWIGPADGPLIVCVHGLTTPSYVWHPIADGLARLGFRVLLYDLYGRGYSDRPRGAQDTAFFVTQLENLLDSLGVGDRITLMGYSMGGAIAAAFARKHGPRLRQLVLLAPAGMGHDLGPVARLVVDYDRFGRWLFMLAYGHSFRSATESERGLDSSIDNVVDRQQGELRWRGFRPAVLSSLRHALSGDMADTHRALAASGLPVLAIWAREDEVIPISGLGRLAEWNRNARQEVIEGAGHAVAYTHDREVLDLLDILLLR
ncbi:MAG: alpha/beta fold hydrolase [Pseudomonadota bacterium]|uniref:alpha/beta fold hydrolase n=1 Tax=Roseovarius TaxID=74030 RepID=UPI0022A69370|nr:alpha/beta hydrolase [Roseovarius sp. EGI FJ00037]MCZ0811123.1 alpha/beta hydrolase [Roseovarius sp. EGI FJ00037]